ncbi:Metal-sulfur cluster biosynthetic protein [Rhodospirillaceae bacterium LM-1]|nr:Metal-sulfur cluster biosynthetic protein [Rhodospirillaceae bacterium LM-1]
MLAPPSRDILLQALKAQVMDPELGVNIVDLGLVERLEAMPDGLEIDLIMTTPTCPQGHGLTDEAKRVLEQAAPGFPVAARLLSEPFWSPDRMSEAARRHLGWAAKP